MMRYLNCVQVFLIETTYATLKKIFFVNFHMVQEHLLIIIVILSSGKEQPETNFRKLRNMIQHFKVFVIKKLLGYNGKMERGMEEGGGGVLRALVFFFREVAIFGTLSQYFPVFLISLSLDVEKVLGPQTHFLSSHSNAGCKIKKNWEQRDN